ncbi:MAG: CBS domain-containing protein [Geminicoccaceae bacterium]|nr:CBS domain-containing protein [Geminicoccaceae bacterium]
MKNTLAKDVLTGRSLVSAYEVVSVRAAAQLMKRHHCGSVVITKHDAQLVGIFTESDLASRVVAANRDPDTTLLGEVMTPRPMTIGPHDTVLDAIRTMHECRFHHLPYVEDDRVTSVLCWVDLPLDDLSMMQPELRERTFLAERIW